MNIGVAANVLIFEKAGIGKYTQNILNNLFDIDHKNHYFLYFTFVRKRKEREAEIIKLLGGKLPKNVHLRFFIIPAQWVDYLTTTRISIKRFIKEDIDLWFAPYASGIARNGFAKQIFTCHDLVFIRFPEHRGSKLSDYYYLRHKIAIKECQKIITPSLATTKDVREYFDVPLKKLVRIFEGSDKSFHRINNPTQIRSVSSKYFNPDYRYILSVGTLEPRKNLIKLVEAYSLLPHHIQKEYKLVLVGAKGWNNSELYKTVNDLNLKNKVILPGFASDEDLPYIYNKASIFVYPSLYEGFGLPVLEAMSCGVPVIVGNNSSLPEIVGKAGILVDQNSEFEIADKIKKLILRPKLAQRLANLGLERAKLFSWEKAAEETLKVFEELGK